MVEEERVKEKGKSLLPLFEINQGKGDAGQLAATAAVDAAEVENVEGTTEERADTNQAVASKVDPELSVVEVPRWDNNSRTQDFKILPQLAPSESAVWVQEPLARLPIIRFRSDETSGSGKLQREGQHGKGVKSKTLPCPLQALDGPLTAKEKCQ